MKLKCYSQLVHVELLGHGEHFVFNSSCSGK